MTALAVDTSVAIPLVVAKHVAHDLVGTWCARRRLPLAGHALAETYAVLTRLPGDLRLAPDDAVRLLEARFAGGLPLPTSVAIEAPALLAAAGVAGGAAYDGLVALAALEAGARLATRDTRAAGTYRRLGVPVDLVA